LDTLPIIENTSIEELRKNVAKDFGLGLGTVYEDYGIFAYSGSYHTTKPMSWYQYNGQKKYVKHPQIDLMVQRYQ